MASNVADYRFSPTLCLKDGFLFCEDVRVVDLKKALEETIAQPSPFFLFSKSQLTNNVDAYRDALLASGLPHLLGYSLKANYSPPLVQLLAGLGCTAVTVSGHELQLALGVGFRPGNIIFNGNGKLFWELQLAVQNGCLINVDSEFDLHNIVKACHHTGRRAQILLRLNPDIDPRVHPYLATGLAKSKFGLDSVQLEHVLSSLKQQPEVDLVGLHCHLGSTIESIDVFSECVDVMLKYVDKLQNEGFSTLRYLNLGGGLGIDYKAHAHRTARDGEFSSNGPTREKGIPAPGELISAVQTRLADSGLTLILEPGRSLVAGVGTFITSVIGTKQNGDTWYVVVDGAMSEVIRPSLYDAYHHIELAEPSSVYPTVRTMYDVVGPVCECADFLGKERLLTTPHEGCTMAVFDAGAYCGSMASNYNIRMRPAEILVDGSSWQVIRQSDNLHEVLKPYGWTFHKENGVVEHAKMKDLRVTPKMYM